MNFQDLLVAKKLDLQRVLVLRHRPREPELNKVLPWLAAERPDVFNAYQQTQTKRVEVVMAQATHVAAFIGHEPGKALFVGLYSMNGSEPITPRQYKKIPELVELQAFRYSPPSSTLWFDLSLRKLYADWKGKLVIRWPPLDKNYYRWGDKPNNVMPVHAILEESQLDAAMPDWDAIDLAWEELRVLPTQWRLRLQEWRGIYYVFDTSMHKGYVGPAYGKENLLGRWLKGYGASGHGGNQLLKKRNYRKFRFTILQRVSPDMDAADVIRLETSWKNRLHTRHPHGLNGN